MNVASPQPQASAATAPLTVRRLAGKPPAMPLAEPVFVYDGAELPADTHGIEAVLLARAGEQRAREWLARGVARVYLGEAALTDGTLVERLADRFGPERLGVYVPARRMEVGWNLDRESNADFRVMRPTICEPCWEILMADGARTGTFAAWWIDEMFRLGASSALVRADVADDTDLDILARLVEQWGERLWVAPLDAAWPDLESWVTLAQATRLAIPDPVYDDHPYLAALRGAVPAETNNEATG